MSNIHQSTLHTTQINQLNSLINKCNGYTPFTDEEEQIDYILHYSETTGELDGLISGWMADAKTCEVTGMVDPNARKSGIFTSLLHTLKLLPSYSNETEFISSLPDELVDCSLNQGLINSEYLLELKEVPGMIKDQLQLSAETDSLPLHDSPAEINTYEYFFSDDDEAYLMYESETDEEPIAVCSLDYQDSFTNVYEVYVDEDLRGKGIGTLFMQHLIMDYFEEADTPLILQVSSQNPAALHLYKKCGFTERSHISYYRI